MPVEQLATKKESFHGLPSGIGELFSLGPTLADGPSSRLIEAVDRDTKVQGLLKVLDSEAFGIAERHRILREWSRQQKLVNESDVVVAPLQCGQHDGVIWQFRNNIPGIPLDVVIQDGPLPMGDAIAIAAQVALGLAELHGEGFLHRDLKPEHILFRGRGKNGPLVALIDAGVSVRIDANTPYPIFGTVGYVSPEQIAGRLVSFRSDLYALGCILFEMLSGAPLFSGEDTEAVLHQHVSAARPDLPDGLPQNVGRLLTSLLERSPRKRPHSAEQVFRTLSPFTDEGVRKSPSITEGEGKEMQRKIDLGVEDSEELRRATLLGLPAQPTKSKRPLPPPSETLRSAAHGAESQGAESQGAESHDHESQIRVSSVPSARALSGAALKPEPAVKEELTTTSISVPPPINALGYRSEAPQAGKIPTVNSPGYSSIVPSGLLSLNIPLEDLDYEDLEDTDAIKVKYEAERDTAGTLVDIPRDPAGTAVLAFDEIEPISEDDIVSASEAPAAIFDGVDEVALDDVVDEESREDHFESFEGLAQDSEVEAVVQAEPALEEAELDLPEQVDAPGLIAMPSMKQTMPMDTVAKAVQVQPDVSAQAFAPTIQSIPPVALPVAQRTPVTHQTQGAAPKSNRAVWLAALMGAFAGTVVLGAVGWWLSGSRSTVDSVATAAQVEATQTDTAPAVAEKKAAPAVAEKKAAPAVAEKKAESRDEDVKILPIEGKEKDAKPEAEPVEAARSTEKRASRKARRERASASASKRTENSSLDSVATAASTRAAAIEPETTAAEPTSVSEPSAFDQVREQAKQAFIGRRYEEAAALYQRATTMNPRHAGSFAGLGASRLAQGDARGAALAYIKAVNLAPQNSRYFVALGHSYLRAGDRANATRAYEKALSINPNLKSAQTALQKLR